MRLSEILLLSTLTACSAENPKTTSVDSIATTQRTAVSSALTPPRFKTEEQIAGDAAWIISAQSQENSLGKTNCENGTCPSIQKLCGQAPEVCVEAFNCATDRFGANTVTGYKNVFDQLEERLDGPSEYLIQRAIAFTSAECDAI